MRSTGSRWQAGHFPAQHFLYFFPDPHGQGSLRPTLAFSRLTVCTPPFAVTPDLAREAAAKFWDEIAFYRMGEDDRPLLERFLEIVWQLGLAGDQHVMREILARILPVTTKIELPPREPQSHQYVPKEDEQQELREKMNGGDVLH